MNNEIFQKFNEIKDEIAMVYMHDNRPWMIGFSGGKDSTLLCTLVIETILSLPVEKRCKQVFIVSSDTSVENPIVKNYMYKMSRMINEFGAGINVHSDIVHPRIENTFWCKVIGLGYPTPEAPGFRWCTDRLKIKPMNEYTHNVIKEYGEVVLLLGVRKDESNLRARNIRAREIEGKLLIPHSDIEKAYIYNPLTEIKNELVWEYLLKNDGKSPWGSDNKYLFSLYQGENLSEEDSVVGKVDENKIKVTGNSRFGCWVCTLVKEDKSLKSFIDKGEKKLIPLRDFRNWLIEMRSEPSMRDTKRRNGAVYLKSDGELGLGPFTLEARKIILKKLLQLQKKTKFELITRDELKQIDLMWDQDGDLSRRSLVNIYYEVFNEKLPWDEYKTPIFSEDVIDEIKNNCDESEIEFELISKLIVDISMKKHYTHSTIITKSFDKILNQGWLHYDAIKKGMDNNAD